MVGQLRATHPPHRSLPTIWRGRMEAGMGAGFARTGRLATATSWPIRCSAGWRQAICRWLRTHPRSRIRPGRWVRSPILGARARRSSARLGAGSRRGMSRGQKKGPSRRWTEGARVTPHYQCLNAVWRRRLDRRLAAWLQSKGAGLARRTRPRPACRLRESRLSLGRRVSGRKTSPTWSSCDLARRRWARRRGRPVGRLISYV